MDYHLKYVYNIYVYIRRTRVWSLGFRVFWAIYLGVLPLYGNPKSQGAKPLNPTPQALNPDPTP